MIIEQFLYLCIVRPYFCKICLGYRGVIISGWFNNSFATVLSLYFVFVVIL
ncbi:hypothetical protein HanOQP8_Chr01g0026981 [Helianthus annuus]|nr:hypothetical protein HanOQP8_Chr01g0026981 [Helianthus annuus]